jgi:CHAT domain-containing protein
MNLALLIAALAGAAVAAPPTPLRPGGVLIPGQPVIHQLRGGEGVEHTIELEAGQFVHVEVDVDQTSLRAELRAPGGEVVVAPESHEDEPPLAVSAVAGASGTWRLSLRLRAEDAGGRIQLTLEPPRAVEPRDHRRMEGERQLAGALVKLDEGPAAALAEGLAMAGAAAAALREAGDERRTAWARFVTAEGTYRQGRVGPAIAEARSALEQFDRLEDDWGRMKTLSLLGVAELSGDDAPASLAHLTRGLELARRGGRSLMETELHDRLGSAYGHVGEDELALAHYDQAVAGLRAHNFQLNLANVLALRGLTLLHRGDQAGAARDHREAAAILERLGDRRGQAMTLRYLAEDLRAVGRPAEALPMARQALAICQGEGFRLEEASSSSALARLLLELGQPEEAKAAAERSLAFYRESGDGDDASGELATIAWTLLGAGRLDEARTAAEEAVALVEASRSRAAGAGQTGAFTSSRRGVYETLVEVLARLDDRSPGAGHAEAALAASERAHARGLLELLAEARVDLREGIDPALLAREREAARAKDAAARRQAGLAAGGKARPEELEAADEALRAAALDLTEVQARIRAQSPRYAEVTGTPTLSADDVRREAGDGSLVLEFFLGAERSHLWAVDGERLTLHRLAGRAVLEEAARRLHRCWSERCTPGEERRLAAEASRLLLGPVASRLRGQRLVVVADGALHYLTFAALPLPGRAGRVVTAHEVVNLPSVSVLAALRRQARSHPPAPLAVAVLADPVFEAGDRRVKGGRRSVAPARPGDTLTRSASDLGLRSLERLRATRQEADTIAGLAPGQVLSAVDFQASRELVTGGALSRYRVIHFATHGLLDDRHPDHSGLVLSMVDEAGAPRDGFLRTGDVFALKLEADLVVLSACQTALGRETRGEGLVGLTRGFMYAGAPRVVASLWRVPDGATAELMRRFYGGLLGRGLPAARALREAQRTMAADPRWSQPYHWAGFALQGLWE